MIIINFIHYIESSHVFVMHIEISKMGDSHRLKLFVTRFFFMWYMHLVVYLTKDGPIFFILIMILSGRYQNMLQCQYDI